MGARALSGIAAGTGRCLAPVVALLATLSLAPGSGAVGPSVSLEQSVEAVTLRDSGPWLAGALDAARRRETALPLAAQTTLRLQWADTFEWPGSATGAADVAWRVRLHATRAEDGVEATHEFELEKARLSWLLPGGMLQLGRFSPAWGKGLIRQASSPLEGMGEAPYAGVLTWAGEQVVAEAGWVRSAAPPFEGTVGTAGAGQPADVTYLRLSSAGARADGALSAGYRTGQGPWASAQVAAPLAGGWQAYAEGLLARPYRPVRMVRPEDSNGWSVFEPPAYGDAAAVRWLAGAWYLSPGNWVVAVEYRYEPGGLDGQEAAAFWQVASGEGVPPEAAAHLAEAWSGSALQALGGLAREELALRRRYLDWAVRNEGLDSPWTWGVAGTFNLDDGSSVWMPEAQYRATGAVTASVRLVLLQGGPSTEYGASPRAWSVQVSLSSSFE